MTGAWAYVFNSLLWSAAGFATGWVIARLRPTTEPKEPAVPQSTFLSWHGHRLTTQRATRILGVIVIVLAIFTVVQSVVTSERLAHVTRCQARFNSETAKVASLRADLADRDREALNNLLLTIFRKQGHEAAQRHAFVSWVHHTEANERERKAHPLPPYPKGDCK